jgi:hypothetical protein
MKADGVADVPLDRLHRRPGRHASRQIGHIGGVTGVRWFEEQGAVSDCGA